MKQIIKLFSSIALLLLIPVNVIFSEKVKNLNFSAVTKTERVEISIEQNEIQLEYFTPRKDYNYEIRDYEYLLDSDGESWVLKGTAYDTLLNTSSDFVVYSNKKFSEMRIGRKVITFTYVEKCDINK
ncbi:MAG: hypothetical protein K5873_04360 [Treponema sp.]|nr:hypothetical protein [Treponema sp.]